ncbi:MAG: hypothetical protein IPK19_30490 [Chloroflexi bacterium]|nr:hypothetical protein [Chloroflexota bacterium]
MKGRRFGVLSLLVIFVGLAILTATQGPPAESNQSLTPVTPFFRVFPELAVLDLAAIRLRSPETNDALTVARDAQGLWQVVDREGTLAEGAGSNLARTISLLPYTSETAPVEALSEYGFQPEGIFSIEIVLIDSATHVVAVGYRTPTADGYYAFIDDRPEMYVLDRAAIDYLISQLREPPVA